LCRIKTHSILKLEDELEVQETKIVWEWETGKLSPGSRQILMEKTDNLRGRRFQRPNRMRPKSICVKLKLAYLSEAKIEQVKNVKNKKTVIS
jgi:hypothetical protein